MGKKIISLFICLSLTFFVFCPPAFALPDAPTAARIAGQTYAANLLQLDAIQQNKMQQVLRNLEYKLSQPDAGPENQLSMVYMADTDPENHLSMAYMAMMTGGASPQAQAVIAAWGVQKYPQSRILLNNLGFALCKLKDYPNAETIYQQALEIDGGSLETIVNLGNLYLDTDRDEEAKAQYERALALDGEYYQALEGLYGYYQKKKEILKATEVALKMKSPGLIMRGRDKMQEEEDARPEAEKLDHIKGNDTIEIMEQKINRIAQTKPLTVAPIVQDVDPAMAAKIKEAMENLPVKVQAPRLCQNPGPESSGSNQKGVFLQKNKKQ